MPFLTPFLPYVLAALLLTNLFSAGGWWINSKRFASYKVDVQAREIETKMAAAEALRKASVLNDALVAQVVRAERQLLETERSANDEIRKLTTGRKCLDGRVVRVLNGSGGGVSAPGGKPVSAHESASSDTDVAVWISGCKRGYDTCRGRLEAIAAFYESQDQEK